MQYGTDDRFALGGIAYPAGHIDVECKEHWPVRQLDPTDPPADRFPVAVEPTSFGPQNLFTIF